MCTVHEKTYIFARHFILAHELSNNVCSFCFNGHPGSQKETLRLSSSYYRACHYNNIKETRRSSYEYIIEL